MALLVTAALVCGPQIGGVTSVAVTSRAQSAASSSPATQGPNDQTGPARVYPIAIPIRPSKFATVAPALPSTVAEPFGPAGAVGELGVPVLALEAYHRAADRLAVEQPGCHLPWWLLAGIGHTESGHAESGRLYPDGTTRGTILGPRLDGHNPGDAVILDTDHGVLDGDTRYDRAVGPMQFIPSTWAVWGADGNGDGKKDPNNIFDATVAAGRYLCAGGRDLSTTAGLDAAVLSYNHSRPYLATVLAWGYAYRDRAVGVASLLAPVIRDVTTVRPPLSSWPPRLIAPARTAHPGVGKSSAPVGSSGASSSSAAASGSGGPSTGSAPPSSTSTHPTCRPTSTTTPPSTAASASSTSASSTSASSTSAGPGSAGASAPASGASTTSASGSAHPSASVSCTP
jgi:membrane-bound lytic murein transglycosylase B